MLTVAEREAEAQLGRQVRNGRGPARKRQVEVEHDFLFLPHVSCPGNNTALTYEGGKVGVDLPKRDSYSGISVLCPVAFTGSLAPPACPPCLPVSVGRGRGRGRPWLVCRNRREQIAYIVEAVNASESRAAMLRGLSEDPIEAVPRLEAQLQAFKEVN